MKNTRKRFSAALKVKVALAAIREEGTHAELSRRFGVHVNLVGKWKRDFLENAERVFGAEGSRVDVDREAELLKKIGELTVERDFLSRGLGRVG